jgi:L-seryl-tRNA(Ser) seleniumtransferase
MSGTGVSITPYMMAAGDEVIVADKLHAVLSKPPVVPVKTPAPPAGDLSGGWDVKIQYAASASTHRFQLRQQGADIEGAHQGDFITRDMSGTIDGDEVRLRSNVGESGGDAFSFSFTGKLAGDQLTGTLDMAEYLGATFTATRRVPGRRRA